MSTGWSSTSQTTNKLSKEDKDARKPIVMNAANDMFSLMQGSRKQRYGVIRLEWRKAKNIYPWITNGMLDHQLKKLKNNQKKGGAIRGLQAIATIDQFVSDLQAEEAIINRTPGVAGQPAAPSMHQKLLKMARKKLSTMLPPYSPNSR
jgi:hypothetical protein